jgi:hypothetical protein
MSDDALLDNLKHWRTTCGEEIWPLMRQAAARIESLDVEVAKLRTEPDSLAGIVQGWHYLAVGPDEMGDYYTHKQLMKLSEPYASPGLRALKEHGHAE